MNGEPRTPNPKHKTLITVVGPTAIGKTALAIKLAQHFETEILSADSRQFFKNMEIGTAVPSDEELSAVKHHFIQHKSIEELYSVGDFERDALAKLSELFKTHDIVIMVGGSGLYVKAVLEGLDHFPDIDPSVREQLNANLKAQGLPYLQQQLKALDPKSYQTVALGNPQRVIRALEVTIGSGQPYSSFLNQKKEPRPFNNMTIGLTAERKTIYDRINRRVDIMMETGLLEETKRLFPKRHLNALKTVGYKELFKHFNGEWDLESAVIEIKKNTRRFAKRQLTWFKKQPDVMWVDYQKPVEHIIKAIKF